MASATKTQLAAARGLLDCAEARFNGAATAVARPSPTEGEFDNNFDGVVTGIFHVVDAFELMTTGLRREVREAEQATRIRSVVLALEQDRISAVPPASRLVNLNTRRNTSVHGEWLEVLDTDALNNAIATGRALLVAVKAYADKHEIPI
jgi:hypothetical protein